MTPQAAAKDKRCFCVGYNITTYFGFDVHQTSENINYFPWCGECVDPCALQFKWDTHFTPIKGKYKVVYNGYNLLHTYSCYNIPLFGVIKIALILHFIFTVSQTKYFNFAFYFYHVRKMTRTDQAMISRIIRKCRRRGIQMCSVLPMDLYANKE